MPSNDFFSFSVVVNNNLLPEYEAESEYYVEANLYSPVSYFIEEDGSEKSNAQKYPVTPFKICGMVDNRDFSPCYIKISVDGQQIWMKPFPARTVKQKFYLNGYKGRDGVIRELLFSLPRLSEEDACSTQNITSEIGCIKVECIEAISKGVFYTWAKQFQDHSSRPGDLSHAPQFNHANKKQCSSAKESVGVATREGRSIGQINCERRHQKQMIQYVVGEKHFGTLCLKYRQRQILEDLGITLPISKSSKRKRFENEKENVKKDEKDNEEDIPKDDGTDACRKQLMKMNCFTPSRPEGERASKLFCFSPRNKMKCYSPSDGKLGVMSPSEFQKRNREFRENCFIKQEPICEDEKQFRLIEIDDDIQIIEEVDDDVIWMGDQSCCFIDVEPPEVPLIDLCS